MKRSLGDHLLSPALLSGLIIGLAGCLAIFNATAHTDAPFYYATRQLVWLGCGLIVLSLCRMIPADRYFSWALPASAVAIVSLFMVGVWGEEVHGMRGWFVVRFGANIEPAYVQPSELAKPIYVLFLVRLAAIPKEGNTISWRQYGQYLLCACIWFVPVALQPDFGTLVIYGIAFATIYWLQGGRVVHLIATAWATLPLVGLALTRYSYLGGRLRGFFMPLAHAESDGWHILQFRTALASGGWSGRSLGETLWSRSHLPLGYSDSIFATLAETLGFIGVFPIVFGIVVWLGACIYRARAHGRLDVALAVTGIAVLISVQAFIHISVTAGVFPPTGLTLPMFSYGGSSLVSTMASIGIISSLLDKGRQSG